MIEAVVSTGYGRPASLQLAAAIGRAKQAGPLTPVTVIVPSNFVGLSARRLLGSGELTIGERPGIANVAFVTPFQFAEHVAADMSFATRPITTPVLGAAVRQALAADPGPYAPVAHHEATEAALASLFAELSNVDEAGLEAIVEEGSTAAHLAVDFHRSIASRLTGFHTEHDLATAAAERVDLADRLASFGHVIWHLPQPLTPALGQFIHRVLREAEGSSVIIGSTGNDEADHGVWRACELGGVDRPTDRAPTAENSIPVGDHIVSVTDAAEEVREVCSRVIALVEAGTSLDRIGIFFPTPDPYVRIIEQQFDAAGLVVNGPDPRRLADSVPGRTLLAALELPDHRWRRDRVMALVSGAPVRSNGERVRPTAWDELTRDAGVVGDLKDWWAKLDRHRSTVQGRIDEIDGAGRPPDDGDAWRRQRLIDRLADLADLRRFVDQLATSVHSVTKAESWPDKCLAATALLTDLLGPEHQHSIWPEVEQDAFSRIVDALVRLAALDEIETSPSSEVFLRALRNEFDVARSRRGRFGHGVMYGPISSAVGHDLEAVFVLGATEGVLPLPRRDDAILPEQVRISSLDQLESKSARLRHQHRAYLAALASAPQGARTILFPRGSLRSSRRSLPSRWLLDTASALAGHTVHATDFAEVGGDVVQTISSFAAGIAQQGVATSVDERDLVAISGHEPVRHPLATLTGAGIHMQVDRASHRFTAFDGNLAGVDTSIGDRAVSPSRLESWAACGFRYFLKYVLDVADRDDPERTDDISALDRGALIHVTLERFIAEAIDRGAPAPQTRWNIDDRARLHEIAAEVADEYEATGRTGRSIHWRVQRDDLRDLLDLFLDVDDQFRRSHQAVPVEVELDLGVRSGDPVEFALPNGRRIAMRGVVDRVDTTLDGRVVVSDYKSGKGAKFKTLDEDPFTSGTTLQLGMYSEGALRHTARDVAKADYWLVESGRDERRGYTWTAELRTRFFDVLTAISDGIESGVFVAAPGDWNTFRQTNEACTYCDYDSVCVRSRGEQADAKASAPEVQVRLLLEPPPSGGRS